MKIKAVITIIAGGKDYAPGALVEISDDEALRLIGRGFAVAGQEKAAPASTSSKTAAPTIEDIVEAIAGLDPTKDYGKNGKPNVEAIEALLGVDITAAQRDQAWDIFRQDGNGE
jgi:hypothetical protein